MTKQQHFSNQEMIKQKLVYIAFGYLSLEQSKEFGTKHEVRTRDIQID